MEVIPKRFGKFGLTIHPTKSRLVPFRPSCPWANDDRGEPPEPPGTFDLLGFTHYWGRSQKGYWIIKQKTATDRFSRTVRSIDSWRQATSQRQLTQRELASRLLSGAAIRA
jgi:hypothetical protein